jgi:predicted amidohydrolase
MEMRVALVQMNSQDDLGVNLREASRLIEIASSEGADLAALPELFTYLGSPSEHPCIAEPIPGRTVEHLSALAARHRMYILGGSFLERVPGEPFFFNTSTMFDRVGRLIGRYGNSLVADPWGSVIARAPNKVGVTVATLDLAYLKKIRCELPALAHRRRDLLG